MSDKSKDLYIKKLEAALSASNRCIEDLLFYVKTISPIEPEEMKDRRKAAEVVIHGRHL